MVINLKRSFVFYRNRAVNFCHISFTVVRILSYLYRYLRYINNKDYYYYYYYYSRHYVRAFIHFFFSIEREVPKSKETRIS